MIAILWYNCFTKSGSRTLTENKPYEPNIFYDNSNKRDQQYEAIKPYEVHTFKSYINIDEYLDVWG